MPGPAPKQQRTRRQEPERGEWKPAAGWGWQHGKPPTPPKGLMPESRNAWKIWMGAWFAAHWTPDDLPGLRTVIRLYDQVERGEYVRSTELRLAMDTYGITPKGQQDRRWRPPAKEEPPKPEGAGARARYAHLRVVDDALAGT